MYYTASGIVPRRLRGVLGDFIEAEEQAPFSISDQHHSAGPIGDGRVTNSEKATAVLYDRDEGKKHLN
jgi:hypothetical protein